MMLLPTTILLALAATTTLAFPLRHITPDDIRDIAPQTSTCAHAPARTECRTAAQAAPFISISFTNFGIHDFNTQAALLALILYESGGFKYSVNHFPGVPGQGTRNMQSPEVNLEYANWLATTCRNCGITAAEVRRARAQGPRAVLALVNSDEWGFGSAAWFWSTRCDAGVKRGLRAGTEAGWRAYLTRCVGTTVTEERTEVWRRAMALERW